MLTHLQRPLTYRYPTELFGHDPEPAPAGGEGNRSHRLGAALSANAVFAVLISAVLVSLATLALR